MLGRDGYPPGIPCWVDTAQPDPEAALGFYGELFGWEFEDRMPAGSQSHYFMATLQGREVAAIGSQPDGTPPTSAWNTYIWVVSVDDTVATVRDAGGSVLMEPFDVFDAGRMAICSDPSGAVFSVWQAREHRGAQLVNEPGTWTWSLLNTRDLEGSKAFYSAVFGWECETLDLGELRGTIIRQPGYGDFLEVNDPGLWRRYADLGAPKGFSDAIGSMMPMTSGQFPDDVSSHWSVSFAVDGTDATAEKAAELGGSVVVAPFDLPSFNAGRVRIAVLRDPQGAVFLVNHFDPTGRGPEPRS